MQELCRWEFDIQTCHIGVHITLGISYSRVMFRVHCWWRNVLDPFQYCVMWLYLLSGLSSEQNQDLMQKLPTYHIRVHKTIVISSCRILFKVHHIWRSGVNNFNYCSHHWFILNNLFSEENIDHIKTLLPQEVDVPTYQIELKKLLEFHLLVSCLGNK